MGQFVGLPAVGAEPPEAPPVPGLGAAQPPVPSAVSQVHDAVRSGSSDAVAPAVDGSADLRAALRVAAAALNAAGIESPRADAELLAGHVLGENRGRVAVLALMGAPVPPGYGELVARRAQRTPLQHLTGSAPFRSLTLAVGPGVFVPRPETELVAQAAIDAAVAMRSAGREHPLVVDLCTGSGAIAAAVASEVPGVRVAAVELSPLAFEYAQRNLAQAKDRFPNAHGLSLVLADARVALQELVGTVDVVVTNPPYIPDTRLHADPEVQQHDPDAALYGGGADGMSLPTELVQRAAQLLRAGGELVMEHDETQERAMLALLRSSGEWEREQVHRDLTGRIRYSSARRTSAASSTTNRPLVGE
ncbi:peptide chain release factor N(5)-glutamine methyltransferase [Galactobacter caseinivorans]|uniref:peptide chain release factor N(5)-glutamine methyltransferase n=1 Tax=Galactobacter caseinivorans TaxID=2676123 RepID=UPI001F449667|nr:peptide chain release factor N(5)-glutamine methyltransferase [Galactobacter caseinivorans]